ncbi:hypothetical protein GA0115242_10611, partial [Streptomyces sp. SolWspMP-5a-2]
SPATTLGAAGAVGAVVAVAASRSLLPAPAAAPADSPAGDGATGSGATPPGSGCSPSWP